MEIIIGRDSKSGKMMLIVDGNQQPSSMHETLPNSVGIQHYRLTIKDGKIRLNNLDINNYTYVNGQIVESKVISPNDKVELGKDHFILDWAILKPYLPIDISHLEKIWKNYEKENIDLQIKERKFNAIRSATGIFTMVAIALSIATGGKSKWYFVLYGFAIFASVIFFVKAYLDSSKIPQKRLELTRQFQRDYVCPKCKHSMGTQPYEFLAQNSHCPYCKTQFIH